MSVNETPDETPAPAPAPAETRAQRLSRHANRTFLYIWSTAIVGILILLIAFIAANTRTVKVGWVFGTSHLSVIWVIVVAGLLGWIAGIATAIVFRFRTRKP